MPDIQNLLIVIGASAGGIESMCRLIDGLPPNLQATLIVATHRSPDRTDNHLANILSRYANLRVSEPLDDQKLDCATLFVGASNEFVTVDGDRIDVDVLLDRSRRMERIDALFASAAEHAGANAVGVVLSGMLWDGTSGLRKIRDAGGRCLVQHPADAQFGAMPMNALREVEADFIGTAEQLTHCIIEIAKDRRCIPS